MELSKTNIVFLVLLGTILVLSYILIFRKSDTQIVIEPFDDTLLREEIAKSDSIANHWQQVASDYQYSAALSEAKSDSIEIAKQKLQQDYDEMYKFNSTASSNQLDSVIRANW